MFYTFIAFDIAREREREAGRNRLANEARAAGAASSRTHRPAPASRTSRARALVALPVRAVAEVSQAMAHAACETAVRIEGRTG